MCCDSYRAMWSVLLSRRGVGWILTALYPLLLPNSNLVAFIGMISSAPSIVWWGLRTPRLAGDPSLTSLMPLAWKQDLEQRAPEQGSAAALTKAALPKGSLLMFLNHNPQSPVSSLSPQEPSNKCLFCSSEFESPPKDSWYRIWYHKWDVTRLSWDLGEGKNWYENLVVHFHVRINSGLTCDPVEPWDSYCVLPEKH